MPSLGADMESGTLVEWLVEPGQRVKRGQVVAVVETQKGAVEVEIWEDGVVDQLVTQPGTKVPVGEVLATLVGPGGAPSGPVAPAAKPAAPAVAPPPAVPPRAPAAAPSAPPSPRKVSPAARRLASELGVDLERVEATGPDGAIQIADVERAAKKRAPAPAARSPAPTPSDKQEAMRQAIAAAMAKSKREIPHYYVGTTICVERALQWLTAENAQRSVKERILFAAVLLRAVALALREVPELNGFWTDGRFRPAQAVHLAVGLALRGGGLISPAIHDAQDKRVPELMAALGDLIQRARAGTVRSSELTDGTVTVTNLGEQGVETVYGVIYPPQVALIGFGKVVERPWVENGGLYVRRVVNATLSADHRASVGHRGALFLAALDRLLQEPENL
jgi:pyruvate dehydrogenase E2 component (dihydrolipoamide acetyltransferase)